MLEAMIFKYVSWDNCHIPPSFICPPLHLWYFLSSHDPVASMSLNLQSCQFQLLLSKLNESRNWKGMGGRQTNRWTSWRMTRRKNKLKCGDCSGEKRSDTERVKWVKEKKNHDMSEDEILRSVNSLQWIKTNKRNREWNVVLTHFNLLWFLTNITSTEKLFLTRTHHKKAKVICIHFVVYILS